MSKSSSPITIAIIGGGFSGSMVAIHLLQSATCPLEIKLIERRPLLGRGIAYETNFSCHLLNVPASGMSAFPTAPNHFLHWLQTQGSLTRTFNSESFVPRKLYGAYIQDMLKRTQTTAPENVRLQRLMDEAIAIKPGTEGATVFLRSGQTLQVHRIVLALGNFPPSDPPVPERSFYKSRRYIGSAWSADAINFVSSDESVLLIGSGLTMLDWAVALQKQGHRGVIHVVSRHGLLPHAHKSTAPYPSFLCAEQAPKSIRALVRRLRQEVQSAIASGHDWRAVIDSLRPETQALWQALPLDQQRQFLRHVRPYWDIHRHRVAPAVADALTSMRHSNQLVLHAGRIQAYHENNNGVDVIIRKRHSAESIVLPVSNVVNCTGPQCDFRKMQHPLIINLLFSGLIRPAPLALGLDVAENGALVDAEGKASQMLYTLGSARKGFLWETIAVPEIREQAMALVAVLLVGTPAQISR